jgi:hypothetical protein
MKTKFAVLCLFAMALVAAPVYAVQAIHAHNPMVDFLFGSGVTLGAAGLYAGRTTGKGLPIPMVGNAPDINAIMGGWVDRGIWPYYDTLKLLPGNTVSNSYNFFSVAYGQPDPNNNNQPKTYVETNLLTANQFNPPRDLIMKSLGFYVTTDATLYDINQLFKYSFFEFKIDEKVFFQGPMVFYPAGIGITGMTTQTTESSWTNGTPAIYASRRFGDYAKYIAPLMRFSLILYFPETINQANSSTLTAGQTLYGQSGSALPTLRTLNQGGSGVWIQAILDGLSDRSVQ